MTSTRRLARAARIGIAGALVVALAACGGDGGGGGPVAADKVEVVDFAFKPGDITVKAGTTVTWTFKDADEHTVASKTGESEIPESPSLKDGKTHTHQFTKAGTYGYHCTLHNSMTGTVVVTAA